MKPLLDIRHIFVIALLLSLVCVFAPSCAKDDATHVDTRPHGDGVVLRLNIQSSTDISTRQVIPTLTATEDELTIKRGYVFVFDMKTGEHVTYEKLDVGVISDNGQNDPSIVSVKLGDTRTVQGRRVVFVFNPKDEVLTDEVLKVVAYDDIDATFPLGGALTNGFVDIANQGLPMYGEVENWNTTTSGLSNMIPIKRSVARLIVQLNKKGVTSQGGHNENFDIDNITYGIFNHAISGYISNPALGLNPSHLNKAPIASITDAELAQKPVLVGATTGNNVVSYLYEYPYATHTIDASGSTTVVNSGLTIYPNRLAIILRVGGGIAPRYYRLDLASQSVAVTGDVVTYLDIERNCSYRLVIDNINDRGSESADLALTGGPSNIQFRIEVVGGSQAMETNGRYAISIGGEPFAGNNNSDPIILAGVATAIENVATDVSYILNAGLTGYVPMPNTITVLKTDEAGTTGNAIIGATVTVTGGDAALAATLTNTNQNLTVNLPAADATPALSYYKLKYVLGSLEYTSGVFIIKRTP